MHTWTRLVPAVLLAVLFAPSLLRAADAKTNADNIEQLQKDLADLRKDLRGLRKDLTDLGVSHNMTAEQLNKIEKLLLDMARRQEASERVSRYGPSTGAPGATATTGTITVQNVYSAPATVRINGQAFRVEAGQTRLIGGVPAGMFQYAVDVEGYGAVEAPRTDTLQTTGYRITIFPRSMPAAN
jgi:capsid protein